MEKRNLSGIYLMEYLDGEKQPVCFEECSKEKQDAFYNSLSDEGKRELVNMLANTINTLGTTFNLAAK